MFGLKSNLFFGVIFVAACGVKAEHGFEGCTTSRDCSYVLLNLATPKGEITCEEVRFWAKCVVRVLGLDKRAPTDQEKQNFNGYLNEILDLLSLQCNIDLYGVIGGTGGMYNAHQPQNTKPTYTASEPIYSAPNPALGTIYTRNEPVYSAPNPALGTIYTRNEPVYSAPNPALGTIYTRNEPVYSAPNPALGTIYPRNEPVYSAPNPALGTINTRNEPVYSAPNPALGTIHPRNEPVYSAPIQAPVITYPRDEQIYSAPTPAPAKVYGGTGGCVQNTDGACSKLPSGDYPACLPLCQKGVYITCSNELVVVRTCPLGWFKSPSQGRFTAPMVYDPESKYCLQASKSCPRDLDTQLETGK